MGPLVFGLTSARRPVTVLGGSFRSETSWSSTYPSLTLAILSAAPSAPDLEASP
jgi:hypothetical protein